MKTHNHEELFMKLQDDVDVILNDFREFLKDDPKDEPLVESHFNVDLVLKNNTHASFNLSEVHKPKVSHKQHKPIPHPETAKRHSLDFHSASPRKVQKMDKVMDILFGPLEY